MVTVSSFLAQAPSPKAVTSTATIIIAFKNFILPRLLSQQVAAATSYAVNFADATLFSRFFGIPGSCSLFLDRYVSTFIDEIEQLDYVLIAHSHASVARRVADLVLVLGAVDVNETVARVGVVLIQAIKPQDARHHQVVGRRKRIIGFQRHATLKNSITRQVGADLLCDTKVAAWCFHAAFFRPDSKSRRGYRVTADWRLVFHQGEALIANRDMNIFHFWLNTHDGLRIKAFAAGRALQKYPLQ